METTEYIYDPDGSCIPFVAKTDLARRLIALRNEAIANGQRVYTQEELEYAMAEERAGGEGLSRIWRSEPISIPASL